MSYVPKPENRAAGFLLGLGLGLVIGILFQPRDAGRPVAAGTEKRNTIGPPQAEAPRRPF